jgi:spermidine synthase
MLDPRTPARVDDTTVEGPGPERSPWPVIAAVSAFVLSGFAALVYQVAWQRILAVFSGIHSWSTTVIVTAYMVGLGFGSLAGGRIADRLSPRASVRAFAACEALVALFAVASPWLYYDLAYRRLGDLVRHPMALPLLHFVLLVVPTLLMGASLPFLSRALVVGSAPAVAKRVAWLYGANTLGAAAGAFATAWWLAGTMGFAGAIRFAASLNVAAAGLALLVRVSQNPKTEGAQPGDGNEPKGAAASLRSWMGVCALAGLIALGLEMVWLRVLGTMIKASPHAFGHLIGVLLVALGLGGVMGASWAARSTAGAGPAFLRLQWGAAVLAAMPFVIMPGMLNPTTPLAFVARYLAHNRALDLKQVLGPAAVRPDGVLELALWLWLGLPLVVMGPAAFLMGASYGFLQRAVQTDLRRVGHRVGLLQAANVLGCAFGSAITGLVLFDLVGTVWTLRVLVALGAVFGLRMPGRVGLVVGLPLALAFALPGEQRFWATLHGVDTAAAVIAEDSSSVVSMQPLPGTEAIMRVNGIGHSVVPYWEIWTLLGVLPVVAHGDAKNVLIIGMGTGTTPWAAAKMPSVARVHLYEIARPERTALAAWETRFGPHPEVREFLEHPRIQVSFTDGRLALRLESALYDVVEADALEPSMAYSGNLYSLDFFREVRRRLARGGVFCTYAPSHRVGETMKAAFPFILDLQITDMRIMLGSDVPLTPDRHLWRERLDAPEVRASFASTPRGTALLAEVGRLLGRMEITALGPESPRPSDDDVNTDLFPRDEFDWRAGPAP